MRNFSNSAGGRRDGRAHSKNDRQDGDRPKRSYTKREINLSEKNQEEASVTTDLRVIALTVTNQKELTLKERTGLKEAVHTETNQREHSEEKDP